jgi:hypothetical protein
MKYVTLEKDDTVLDIGGTEFPVVVTCEVGGVYIPSCSGEMRSGSSSYEDLLEVPSAATFDAEESVCTIVVFDEGGIELGTLKLRGVEWFDLWFDDENVINEIIN